MSYSTIKRLRRTIPTTRAHDHGVRATVPKCEWPILEPTRMRGATLSTLTELKMKVITNCVLSKYACLHDFQWCSDRCCTTRSRRQNNYQIQQVFHRLITNSREEEPKY